MGLDRPRLDRPRLSRLRPLFLPGLVAGVAVAILIGLGLWQVQRKAWKDDLIARIAARAHRAPVPVPPSAEWPGWRAAEGDYVPVRAVGTYRHDRAIRVRGLAPGEGPGRPLAGVHVLTPLELEGGGIVVVHRGFVAAPPDRPAASLDLATLPRPAGRVTVTGLMRAPEPRGAFTPADDPARGEFYTRDPAAVPGLDGPVAPFLIDADAASEPGPAPRGGLTRLSIPNHHLQYALTWFDLAAVLLAIFTLWARQRPAGG